MQAPAHLQPTRIRAPRGRLRCGAPAAPGRRGQRPAPPPVRGCSTARPLCAFPYPAPCTARPFPSAGGRKTALQKEGWIDLECRVATGEQLAATSISSAPPATPAPTTATRLALASPMLAKHRAGLRRLIEAAVRASRGRAAPISIERAGDAWRPISAAQFLRRQCRCRCKTRSCGACRGPMLSPSPHAGPGR